MPTYQYSCTDCGHFFETVQSFSDDSLTTCAECEGRLRKVFNAVGVVFKGSGFYRNDTRPTKDPESGSDTKPGDAKPKKPAEASPSTPNTESTSSGSSSVPAATA